MHCAITVVVDKGKAEDVIDAATAAGSKGGTVINATEGRAFTRQAGFFLWTSSLRRK